MAVANMAKSTAGSTTPNGAKEFSWSDSAIGKEADFQKAKHIKQQIDAILDGTIDATTCDDELLRLAVAEKEKRKDQCSTNMF